jgi:hypothetical protein
MHPVRRGHARHGYVQNDENREEEKEERRFGQEHGRLDARPAAGENTIGPGALKPATPLNSKWVEIDALSRFFDIRTQFFEAEYGSSAEGRGVSRDCRLPGTHDLRHPAIERRDELNQLLDECRVVGQEPIHV